MCPMRAAQSHATPPSHRLPLLDSDTTPAVGNFLNLARTLPLLPMLLLQVSRSPSRTGVCLVQLGALFVPRVPGGWGEHRLAGKGAVCSGGGAGGRVSGSAGRRMLGGGATSCTHTRRVTLCGRKRGGGSSKGRRGSQIRKLHLGRVVTLGRRSPRPIPRRFLQLYTSLVLS